MKSWWKHILWLWRKVQTVYLKSYKPVNALKQQLPPSWIYFRWLFLTCGRLSTVDLNHHTKFRAHISIHDWIVITFENSRWRPSVMLDFQKTVNWPICRLRLLIVHHCSRCIAKCWPSPKLWPKNKIQNGSCSHLGFTVGGEFLHRADFPPMISTTT